MSIMDDQKISERSLQAIKAVAFQDIITAVIPLYGSEVYMVIDSAHSLDASWMQTLELLVMDD